ncbi:MAG: ribonuclease R [Candidatus Kapabacteria bacterium]|nr:ribonuclease R [Candidatus Kapabacteria bacterium]MCS7169000.1 ribonuclease R [Candidatus Kapabacteria bacterium]MDW7997202.1 ribonuclease R [Bacteroidota bacterium]MDW8224766.1 ribonuclease R [Bacteroidota bacterium]
MQRSVYPELAEAVLRLLRERPRRLYEIARHLKIGSRTSRYEELLGALEWLQAQGLIERGGRRRYRLRLPEEQSLIEGELTIEHGIGIVRSSHPEYPEIIVRRHHLNTALPGDQVLVCPLRESSRRKPRGEIVNIVHRSRELISGTVEYDGNFFFLVPDDEGYYVDFLLPPDKLRGAQHGDKALARFIHWGDPLKSPEAEIVEILGRAGDPRAEFSGILREFELPFRFPPDVEEEARSFAHPPTAEEIAQRRDFRHEVTFTIDPDDAKDYDDALSIQRLPNGNLLLGVHIADVSFYVTEGSLTDEEAFQRGTSVYLVDRVVPMLPEVLSNDICSLVPDQDRLTYSVLMEFTPEGILRRYELCESVICSRRRFTYDEVQHILTSGKGPHAEHLLLLHQLAQSLRQRRFREGGIDFETIELKFRLDSHGFPAEVTAKSRTDATGLVEECMLAANRVVAAFIQERSRYWGLAEPLPFLYRIHDVPDPTKVREVIEILRALGIPVRREPATSQEWTELLRLLETRPEKPLIHQFLLRAMAKAVYSPFNIGHYGLGFPAYAHFTSPIRRYPDLIAHRLLKRYSQGRKPSLHRLRQLQEYLERAGEHCSRREQIAVEAERASIKAAQTLLASRLLGRKYWGTVTGLVPFGMFVLLDTTYIEGLLPLREMPDDFYTFDERRYRFIGKSTRTSFTLGSRLKVQLVSVDLKRRHVDLRLARSAHRAGRKPVGEGRS